MKHPQTRLLSALLAAALCLGLLGCGAQSITETETENLVKLCKVWGYVKYRHPAFLQGKKDWDEELLALIPQVRAAETAEAVNELLCSWFENLGEIDYERRAPVPGWSSLDEDKKVFAADTAWVKDTGYLGEELAAAFAQLPEELPNVSRKYAPVTFDPYQRPVFDNEPEHEAAYDDPNFRLLGLFRLWNAFEYYYPYLPLPDRDWTEPLAEQIPNMLAGTDGVSYKRTLWLLARETRDSHNEVYGGPRTDELYRVPVSCIPAEGRPVVWCTAEGFPLERGDVLLSIDGQTVDEILEEDFGEHPRKEVAIEYEWTNGIFCEGEQAELGILRGGKQMTITCNAVKVSDSTVQKGSEAPYELLDNNIGYININMTHDKDLLEAIEAFQDTRGLVIDLREYPQFWPSTIGQLWAYVLGKGVTPLVLARPSAALPGAYAKNYAEQFGIVPGFTEHYDKTVAVLINEGTGSTGETYAAVFRAAENTVLMGSNTNGCNGDVVSLPLPGGLQASFSSIGVYNLDGTQTQRVGIAPDIRVEPTIQGITEGRDEVLEAAIEYIQTEAKGAN